VEVGTVAISREQVEHVARLARLGLDEDEKDRFQGQLSQILETMRVIDRLDTSTIPPTAQVIPLQTVLRDDTPRPSLPVEDVLRNAPRREGDFLKVPPVLEGEERDG
jgi:aspartyl-tRNA(Asn)/glutamyl-tRNA(Gln) amidotransferase subunit C